MVRQAWLRWVRTTRVSGATLTAATTIQHRGAGRVPGRVQHDRSEKGDHQGERPRAL